MPFSSNEQYQSTEVTNDTKSKKVKGNVNWEHVRIFGGF